MDNDPKKREVRKRLLALSMAGMMFGTSGCAYFNSDDGVPIVSPIDSKYNNFDNYYKYSVKNDEAIIYYKTENIYLLIDKTTYTSNIYIFNSEKVLGGLGYTGELYDIETGELLVYCDGLATTYNEEYFDYLKENNYEVCLKDLEDYIEGEEVKEYYTLDEIMAFEPQIVKSLKIINKAKTKTLD